MSYHNKQNKSYTLGSLHYVIITAEMLNLEWSDNDLTNLIFLCIHPVEHHWLLCSVFLVAMQCMHDFTHEHIKLCTWKTNKHHGFNSDIQKSTIIVTVLVCVPERTSACCRPCPIRLVTFLIARLVTC